MNHNVRMERTAAHAPLWQQAATAARRFVHSPWAPAGVVLLGAVLRLFLLGSKSLWHDEAYSMAYAQTSVAYQLALPDAAPPLFHLLLHFWLRMGDSDLWLRLPSALAGIGAVAVTYGIGRRIGGRRMGLVLGLLSATSPLLIWHAQEARYYSLLYFFSTLSIYFYLQVKDEGGARAWTAYLLSSLLCLAIHYYALLVLLVENVDFLLSLRPRHLLRWQKGWALAQAGLAACFLPWSFYFLGQVRAAVGGETFYPRPDLASVLQSFAVFVAGRVQPIPDPLIVLLFLGLGGWGLWLTRRRGQPLTLWLLLLLLPVGLSFAISQRVPIYETKHLIASSLACHVLLAYAVTLTRRRVLSAAVLCAALGPALIGVAGYYAMPPRQDWHAAARLVEQQQQPGDAILFDGAVGYLGFDHYYTGGLDTYGLYGGPSWRWQMPGEDVAAYPLHGAFWANYGALGSYFPAGTLPAEATWRCQPEEIGRGYRRLWLVLFFGRRSPEEYAAYLGAQCRPATDEPLGAWHEIRLYRCDLTTNTEAP